MAYTQHFGLSRNSPLNERQSIMQNTDGTAVDVKKEILEKKVNTLNGRLNKAIDTDPSKASTIISQNNNKSQVANAAVGGSKFVGKQLVKEGLKKYVGPMVSKVFGVASMMLSPTTAYGGSYDQTQFMERELSSGDPEKIAGAKEFFFNDQYKNFDSQTDFQKGRLKDLNKKYDLGYLQKDLQYFKDVKTDEM